jgi:periplasmic protein CpxP/Spy
MSRFAQQALSAKHAYVAALLAGASAFAAAQSATIASDYAAQSVAQSVAQPAAQSVAQANTGASNRDGTGDGAHGRRFDPAKVQAWHAKRMAALKERLKITPDQESNWTSFAAGVAPPAADPRTGAVQRPNLAELEKLSTPERLDKLRAFREAREGQFKAVRAKLEEAVKTFYPTLSADQKKVFDAAMLRLLQRRMGGHGGHGEHGQSGRG